MSTIVGVECTDGVVLAADRLLVQDGTVRSTSKRHLFDLDSVAGAAVGDGGAVDAFGRRLEAEVREYRLAHDGDDPSLEVLTRIASELAGEEAVDAIVAGDDDGVPRIRTVSADGGVVEDPRTALGSGAALALGQLESAAADLSVREAETLVENLFAAVAERDPGTGAERDVWTRMSPGDDGD